MKISFWKPFFPCLNGGDCCCYCLGEKIHPAVIHQLNAIRLVGRHLGDVVAALVVQANTKS
jgi:hypothetical protein